MSMTESALTEGARLIAEARRQVSTLEMLPDHCRPRTVDEGYAMQAAFRRLWGQPIVGWKVGATARPVQELFGITHPFYGPIFAPDVLESPARPAGRNYQHLMIEGEFAVRLGRDLPARAKPYARDEIGMAIDAVIPAFELISPRFAGLPTSSVASAIADCGVNAGAVLGLPVKGWQGLDLAGQQVRLAVDGRIVAEGSGALVLGNPLNVLDWLVNALSAQGIGLTAGQFISTGTCTGLNTVKAGETAVADFGEAGSVEMTYV